MKLTAILCAVATISTLTHAAPPFMLHQSHQQGTSLQTVLLRAEDGTTFALRPVEPQNTNQDPPTVTITAQGEVIRGASSSAQQQDQSPFIVVDRRQFESFAGAAAAPQPQQGTQVVFLQRPETNAAFVQSSDVRNTGDIVTLRATRIEPSREQEDQAPVVTIRRSDLEALIAREQANAGAQQQQVTRVLSLRPVTNADNSQGFIFQTTDERQVQTTQAQQVPQLITFQAQQAQPQQTPTIVRLTSAVTQQGVAQQAPNQHVAQQAVPQGSSAGSFVPLTFPLHPLHSALAFPQLNAAASNPFLLGPQGPVHNVHQDQSQRRSSGSGSSRRDREREERNS
jgi:hypothetical protein